jgi:hypothetical protein
MHPETLRQDFGAGSTDGPAESSTAERDEAIAG